MGTSIFFSLCIRLSTCGQEGLGPHSGCQFEPRWPRTECGSRKHFRFSAPILIFWDQSCWIDPACHWVSLWCLRRRFSTCLFSCFLDPTCPASQLCGAFFVGLCGSFPFWVLCEGTRVCGHKGR